MSLFQLDYNISPPLLSQTRLAVITGNKVCRVNSQLHKLLSVFHLRIDGCLSFSSGLLLSVPLSEGEINKDACGTPAQNSIHTLLLTLARNINQPVRVKEKWLIPCLWDWGDAVSGGVVRSRFLAEGLHIEQWLLQGERVNAEAVTPWSKRRLAFDTKLKQPLSHGNLVPVFLCRWMCFLFQCYS